MQIANITQQAEKHKNMYNDKKGEFAALLERYNEVQKKVDGFVVTEKKLRQELVVKDKQIVKLIEEVDKKNGGGLGGNKNLNNNNLFNNNDKEFEKMSNELKRVEKQKNEIYQAFKKSLKLISILKRQKVHLENARLLTFTEEEFKSLIENNK